MRTYLTGAMSPSKPKPYGIGGAMFSEPRRTAVGALSDSIVSDMDKGIYLKGSEGEREDDYGPGKEFDESPSAVLSRKTALDQIGDDYMSAQTLGDFAKSAAFYSAGMPFSDAVQFGLSSLVSRGPGIVANAMFKSVGLSPETPVGKGLAAASGALGMFNPALGVVGMLTGPLISLAEDGLDMRENEKVRDNYEDLLGKSRAGRFYNEMDSLGLINREVGWSENNQMGRDVRGLKEAEHKQELADEIKQLEEAKKRDYDMRFSRGFRNFRDAVARGDENIKGPHSFDGVNTLGMNADEMNAMSMASDHMMGSRGWRRAKELQKTAKRRKEEQVVQSALKDLGPMAAAETAKRNEESRGAFSGGGDSPNDNMGKGNGFGGGGGDGMSDPGAEDSRGR